jgi:hypothetical protein
MYVRLRQLCYMLFFWLQITSKNIQIFFITCDSTPFSTYRKDWDGVPQCLSHKWLTIAALDDRWEKWSIWWIENWHTTPKYLKKTYPSAILSTTNLAWTDLRLKPGGKPASNCLSHGLTLWYCYLKYKEYTTKTVLEVFWKNHHSKQIT